jgi:Zn-dependent protease with chaperone function
VHHGVKLFAGIIKLMNRNEDMLATIIGHESAHALARHSSEKITLGLFVALAVQVGMQWLITGYHVCAETENQTTCLTAWGHRHNAVR